MNIKITKKDGSAKDYEFNPQIFSITMFVLWVVSAKITMLTFNDLEVLFTEHHFKALFLLSSIIDIVIFLYKIAKK